MKDEVAYRLGGAKTTVTIPAFTVVPADCVQTLKVTIPTALAKVCTVTTDGKQLAFEGAADAGVPGEYEITAQAKTAAGTLVPEAILTIKVKLEAASGTAGGSASVSLQATVTAALATSAALFGASSAVAGGLSAGAVSAGAGTSAGSSSGSVTADNIDASAAAADTSADGSGTATDANEVGGDVAEGGDGESTGEDNFDADGSTI